MEIQMLLNNRCCSEKENFFFFLIWGCLRFFVCLFVCSLEKRAEGLLQHIEELHPNKIIFSWGMGFIGYLPLLDFGGKLVNKKKYLVLYDCFVPYPTEKTCSLFLLVLCKVWQRKGSHIQ